MGSSQAGNDSPPPALRTLQVALRGMRAALLIRPFITLPGCQLATPLSDSMQSLLIHTITPR